VKAITYYWFSSDVFVAICSVLPGLSSLNISPRLNDEFSVGKQDSIANVEDSHRTLLDWVFARALGNESIRVCLTCVWHVQTIVNMLVVSIAGKMRHERETKTKKKGERYLVIVSPFLPFFCVTDSHRML